jgi:hypothetical protein
MVSELESDLIYCVISTFTSYFWGGFVSGINWYLIDKITCDGYDVYDVYDGYEDC